MEIVAHVATPRDSLPDASIQTQMQMQSRDAPVKPVTSCDQPATSRELISKQTMPHGPPTTPRDMQSRPVAPTDPRDLPSKPTTPCDQPSSRDLASKPYDQFEIAPKFTTPYADHIITTSKLFVDHQSPAASQDLSFQKPASRHGHSDKRGNW